MKRSEDQAEEKADDDDSGEADRKHIIKRDGFKDDSEDTMDEEVMMQDKAPKHQEIGNEELASAVDITEVTGTKRSKKENRRTSLR
jgi:hypothetical protein